jgi:hypothetical protein
MTLDGSVNTGLSAGQRQRHKLNRDLRTTHCPHEHRNPVEDRRSSVQVYMGALITFASAVQFKALLAAWKIIDDANHCLHSCFE